MVDAGDIATSAPMCQHRQRIATPQETTTTASPSYVGGIAATKGRHAVRDNSNGTVNVLATATTVCFCSAAQTAATVDHRASAASVTECRRATGHCSDGIIAM